PDLRSILGETVQPAVLHPGDMPDHKADGVRFRPGAPGQFGRRETLQRTVETPFTLLECLFKESFKLHSDSSWTWTDAHSEHNPVDRGCRHVCPLAAIVFWRYSPFQQCHRVQHQTPTAISALFSHCEQRVTHHMPALAWCKALRLRFQGIRQRRAALT